MRTAVTVLAAALLVGCASQEDDTHAGEVIVVSGVVKVTGSEGDAMLILATDDQRYEIVGDLAEGIWKLQQRRITVRGRVVEEARAPGIPALLKVIAIEDEAS